MKFDFENHAECRLTGDELGHVINRVLDMDYAEVARLVGLHQEGKEAYGRTTIKQMVRGKRRISPPLVACLWFVCADKVPYDRDWPVWMGGAA